MLAGSAGGRGEVWVAAAVSEGDRRAARLTGGARRVTLSNGLVDLRSIVPDRRLYDGYYDRVANQTLWFLHHQLFSLERPPAFGPEFDRAWRAYRDVNDLFANACAEEVDRDGEVLLQDYHLSLAPALLRRRRADVAIAHFTSCPWADPDCFRVLPEWTARALLEGLLGADLLGFMARRWADNFLGSCRDLGHPVDAAASSVRAGDGRVVQVCVLPVGVDPADLRRRCGRPEFAIERRFVEELAGDRRLIVRVDRMDPSKNILRGLRAYELFLDDHPEARGAVVHYALAYASRSHLPEYRDYAAAVEQQSRRINARFGGSDWTPVHLDTTENRWRALGALSLADVLVVNPVRDGMNLVCKEGPAVSARDVVLILSREAGAADVMARGALMVDPFDTAELARAVATALSIPDSERRARAVRLRIDAVRMPPRMWFDTVRDQLRGVRARSDA